MKRILIVDDNFDFLQLLSSILEEDFETFEATGVQEAIKLMETITVDAICSDYSMRDGTGLDLLKQLRQQGVKTPFMLMSASDDYHLSIEAQSWGATFCAKPARDFIKKIKSMV